MPTLRLPRLGCSINGCRSGSSWKPPMLMKPRWVSPRTGCSTLMTSAPQSARMAPAAGTKVNCATSRTRTPSITLIKSALPVATLVGNQTLGTIEDRVKDEVEVDVVGCADPVPLLRHLGDQRHGRLVDQLVPVGRRPCHLVLQ